MTGKKTDKPLPRLDVINDSANYDIVVREPRPFKLSAGTVDFSDREKYPLAEDHERFKPIEPPAAS